MSRSQSNNPFEDILQPQPRHARPTFQDDPFGDDDDDIVHENAGGGASGQSRQSADHGGRHGYALDPFFDEYVKVLWRMLKIQ